MKIYLDDCRGTPEGWHRCYKIEEVQELLKTGTVENMSLDHDLGASYICQDCNKKFLAVGDCSSDWTAECNCQCHNVEFFVCPTGYDLCKWMAENDIWSINKPIVHSANPVGSRNMRECINRYWHAPGTPKKY